MRHTGELFIKTPEAEHPLNIKLELITGKSADPHVLSVLEHELEHAVLWFFDLQFDELVDFHYAPEQSKFALSLLRTETLNSINRMIRNDITDSLVGKNIVGFGIISLTDNTA
jgi:hypothetical protein